MVANSIPSQTSERRRTKKTKRLITPAEASQILASAISYCNEAGLVVTGRNVGDALYLEIEGVNYVDGQFVTTTPAGSGDDETE